MSGTLSASAFATSTLPEIMPIFPLSGTVLLPRARLPLHIFEPRYLAMIDDVLAAPTRMIGIIQPAADGNPKNELFPALYSVGCAGRLTSFAETEDGRLMIALSGVCRFEIAEEPRLPTPYRQARPDWSRYLSDMQEEKDFAVDHVKLSGMLKSYFKAQSIEADLAEIEGMSDEMLVATLVMICPFAPNEKQALLESRDSEARAAMLMALLAMSSIPPADGNARH